ncbi:NrsF family protein [Phreatobacter sp.]|uniref:NrsF family protein n=1 Tax=Phreatobacter sp. TaxID=1966341 RepID=UPI003F7053D3
MKTDDLIEALSRDATVAGPAFRQRMALAVGVALASAMILLWFAIAPRPDLAAAIRTLLFDLKIALVATLAVAMLALLAASFRPEARLPLPVLAVPLILLAFGIGHELATQLPQSYVTRLVGRNASACLTWIPLMSIVPLGAFLALLRAGAPADPMRAGAIAGLAAGSVAALFYAFHCTDDSPLFVATWYPIGIGLVAALGALAGRRLLVW